ncbi:unnamed protein product [Trifolium pratense]|uniref:Uncharacterized protein n=1 Tax=Trifolium pratense TaxID=57577 RepID=A0ACB0K780_TRIPR|nr:unnamed protein product [Trifolium pratense]
MPLFHIPHTLTNVTAPGIARVPKTTSAQRWHQRLGHTGQKILKKTAQCSKGMEGLDTSELSTCETCHLSKAQRYVSRQPRPIPFEPLDEVFIDTVGKLTPATNGHQYAVIITDAKSRMRWAITTRSKDQIAPQLEEWVEHQYHQYGKRVRIIFRDGGSEFLRIKSYCEQHGIRTDVSAPYTPEQNGVSEASNKVILRKARSILIDAKMPACYWPWAIEHACYLTNRLYCLSTKSVPLLTFLKDLRQPHPNQIDFTNLPRFGCRAYKLINPKPGKFEPRATMGWFIGFQKNTDKNFLIYHPHWTSAQGWKWIVSITPHVTFNEDIVFGDKLSSIERQHTTSYWSNIDSIFTEPSSLQQLNSPDEHTAINQSTHDPNAPLTQKENPPSTPNHSTINIEQEDFYNIQPQSPIIIPDIQSQRSHNVPSSPSLNNLPLNSTDLQVIPENELADQRETSNEATSDDEAELTEQDEPYDRIMTGWDPIQPAAGTKHNRLSDRFGCITSLLLQSNLFIRRRSRLPVDSAGRLLSSSWQQTKK